MRCVSLLFLWPLREPARACDSRELAGSWLYQRQERNSFGPALQPVRHPPIDPAMYRGRRAKAAARKTPFSGFQAIRGAVGIVTHDEAIDELALLDRFDRAAHALINMALVERLTALSVICIATAVSCSHLENYIGEIPCKRNSPVLNVPVSRLFIRICRMMMTMLYAAPAAHSLGR